MPNLPTLETDLISAYFDEESGISFVTYRSVVDKQVSTQLYTWVSELLPIIGTEATYGVVYDFRQVRHFKRDGVSATRRNSGELNQRTDNSNHPVAMIVATNYQEQMVGLTKSTSPSEDRTKIVYSLEAALKFIEDWHNQRQARS